MEFDRSKILTVVTADQAKVGMKGWFSNDISSLKIYIERGDEQKELQSVDFHSEYTFREQYPIDGSFACKYRYFYPAPEPSYRPFKNAEEFKPYREKWIRYKNNINAPSYEAFRLFRYSDDDIQLLKLLTWEQAFNDVVFEDGTPFGIKEEA